LGIAGIYSWHYQCEIDVLVARYGINPKTVGKWRKRTYVTDARPKEVRSTVLSVEEEAAVIAFRRHTLLSLDDCLYALQASIPHLPRSSLHRCLQRHGISRLPQLEEGKTRSRFKQYPIGYFHIDIAEVQTEKASSISLLPSTVQPSSLMSNSMRNRIGQSR
jgi:hypothetical protein